MTKKKPAITAFNPNLLTLGELEQFEDELGIAFQEAFKRKVGADGTVEQVMTTKAIIGFAWIIKKRDTAEFTIDDARGLTLSELDVILESVGDSVPLGNDESSEPNA